MYEAFIKIATAFGVVTIIIIALFILIGLAAVINNLVQGKTRKKIEKDVNAKWLTSLHMLDRWLSYDFPVVEDITYFFQERVSGSAVTYSELRKMLRKKYNSEVHVSRNFTRIK